MTLLPVITRELRAAARLPFTYYLRVLGVGALLLASFLFGMQYGFGPNLGGLLFANLHQTLFFAIWILVPMLTADCISRERREGTLGLLFMTPLKGTEIVVAKSLAHGVRATSLWVAMLPVLTVPFTLGGVSWHEAAMSLMINFCALCWALTAGLLASAWSKLWIRALLRAAMLAILFLLVFGLVPGLLLTPLFAAGLRAFAASNGQAVSGSAVVGAGVQLRAGIDYSLTSGLGFISNFEGHWTSYLRLTSAGGLLLALAQVTAVSVIVLGIAIVLAGIRTRRSWQEDPPSASQLWFEKTFCTPFVWLSFFRRWMGRKLENNPIGWLEQRTWSGRLVIWGWLGIIIFFYAATLGDTFASRTYPHFQGVMAALLAGSVALSAAGSFRRERESGILELLLVSPMGAGDIVTGRLKGLWGQFLPAFGLLLFVWAYLSSLSLELNESDEIAFYAITFLTLPVIGLYFSLRCRNFVSAFIAALFVGLLVPVAAPALFRYLFRLSVLSPARTFELDPSGIAALLQVVLAVVCWDKLITRLKKRDFPLGRAD